MDKTKKLFDEWAVTGRAEEMEKGNMRSFLLILIPMLLSMLFPFLLNANDDTWQIETPQHVQENFLDFREYQFYKLQEEFFTDRSIPF